VCKTGECGNHQEGKNMKKDEYFINHFYKTKCNDEYTNIVTEWSFTSPMARLVISEIRRETYM